VTAGEKLKGKNNGWGRPVYKQKGGPRRKEESTGKKNYNATARDARVVRSA